MICLGKILKTRGNKGEVVYTSPDAHSYVPKIGEVVLLKSQKYRKEITIQSLREIKGAPLVKFENIDTINDAWRLIGYSMYRTDESIPPEAPTPHGVKEYIVKDVDGETWGEVESLETVTLNLLMEIRDSQKNQIYLVPFSDQIVVEIDHHNKIIVIDPPAGLKDLNKE